MIIRIVIIISILCYSCNSATEDTSKRIRPVKYMVVKKNNLSDIHTFTGAAQSVDEVNLSFKVAGTISDIKVKVGDIIRKGEVIATIDPSDYKVSLQQAEAQERGAEANEQSSATQIKSAEANYIAASSSYERITKLYENNSVSLSEFEQTKANYEASLAQYEAAKSQYEAAQFSTTASRGSKVAAQNQVNYTRLKAPFYGVVTGQLIEENELVNSGTPVISFSSIGRPEVQVGVPEVLISKVVEGMITSVTFSSIPDKVFEAKVTEVGYSSGSGSTYPVTVDLLSTDPAIRPGMPANITFSMDIPDELAQKILIPAASVGEDGNGRFVYKLIEESDGRTLVKRQSVSVGKLRNAGFEVMEGLEEGDMIASAGLNILLDGDEVRLN